MTAQAVSEHVIIGTAGHVDHGKTTLIKALTGTDTDRLKEEKERGMTIDLGFTSLKLPSGRSVGIVDVPGHERFLKNMLAGATGVDLVLLVVAADEGVMPQTREHLNILRLLETKTGIVALTKVDMVEEEWLEMVEEDLRDTLKGSFLEDSPIVRVSGLTGQGVKDMLQYLDNLVSQVQSRNSAGPFRLPVDRVFTLTGFGTVVTGTLVSGEIRVGDAVNILPKGIETRVRNVQVHGEKRTEAQAGTRVAVNLSGVDVSDIDRGDVLVPPGYLQPSFVVDMLLRMLADAPGALKSQTRVRLHTGTAEILGRVIVLDGDEIAPGQEAFVQFRAESPVVAARGDRFVIRTYSPMHTIGGGVILEPNARKHKRRDTAVIAGLKTRLSGDPRDITEDALMGAPVGTTAKEIARVTGLAPDVVTAHIKNGDIPAVLLGGEMVMHEAIYQSLASRIVSALESYHQKAPLKAGMLREELRGAVAKGADARVFGLILTKLENEGKIVTSDKLIRHSSFELKLGEKEKGIARDIEEAYLKEGLTPSTVEEAVKRFGADSKTAQDVFDLLVEQGKLIKIEEGLYVHKDAIVQAEQALRDHLAKAGKITVSEFRDLTGSSRKYALPLLQYFDSKRVTRRVGDDRVLFGR